MANISPRRGSVKSQAEEVASPVFLEVGHAPTPLRPPHDAAKSAAVRCFETRQPPPPHVGPQAVPASADKSVLMSEVGRQRVATREECLRVHALALEGMSVRRIAEEVFGNQRFRGRVERILHAPEPPTTPDGGASISESTVLVETVPTVRAALARHLARVARGGLNPSVGELVKLLDLERRLQTFESLEQINALSRSVDGPLEGE